MPHPCREISIHSPLKRPAVIAFSILAVVHAASPVMLSLLLGQVIDDLIRGTPPYRSFSALALIALTTTSLDWGLKRMIRRISRDWESDLQMRMLETYQTFSPGNGDRFRPGDVALKFFRDAAGLGEFLRNGYPQFLGAVCGTVFALAAAGGKNILIALLFLFFAPLLALPVAVWCRPFRRLRGLIRRFNDSAMNRIFECMHILPYLKSLAAETPYVRETRRRLVRYCSLNRRNDRAEVDFEGANRAILFLGEYGILAVSCVLAYQKTIPVGDVVVFQMLFLSELNALSCVFRLLPNMENVRESLRSINELLTADATECTDAGTVMESAAGDISVRSVTFQYPGSKRAVLQEFSCDIPGGGIVGISGENGAGKTTLLKLLSGYLTPQQGSVTVNGVDLRQCSLAAFRRRVASVFQETLLITGTIRDNITLKDNCYTAADIDRALKLSGADVLVARMPEGLAHRIGFNDGGGLSGGERQKLAIARALIRRPDILIFDEVTNHLDHESRLRMRDLLTSLRGRTTVLLVSHDPELLRLCDQEIRLAIQE